MYMADTYVCAQCLGEFLKGQTEEQAVAEAYANFGVANAAECDDMAIVCDDCYRQILGIGVGSDDAKLAGQALADQFLALLVETLTKYIEAELTKEH